MARLALALGVLLVVLAPATMAWAQTDGNGDYPVSSTSTTQTCNNCGTTATTISVKGESTLPFTGGDVALVTILGLAAAGSGAFLVWLGRRSTSAT